MKKLTVVALVLMMLLAVSVSSAETALTGLKIGMSQSEVAEAVGEEPKYNMDLPNGNKDVEYVGEFAGYETGIGCVFQDDKLIMLGYYQVNLPEGETLDNVKEKLAAEYGEAADVAPEKIAEMFAALSGVETSFTFTEVSGWHADGTADVLAFYVDDVTVYVVYVSTDYPVLD